LNFISFVDSRVYSAVNVWLVINVMLVNVCVKITFVNGLQYIHY